MAQENLELLINDSWSGATVCTTVRPAHPIDTAFVRRMQKTLNGDLRPDVIVLFGGTNDSWIDCPLGENKYSGWTEKDDRSVLPAFCHMISYVKEHNPQAKVLCVLNTELKEEIGVNVQAACAHFGVFCVKLKEIDKVDGHPNDKGMQQIADQVARALREAY